MRTQHNDSGAPPANIPDDFPAGLYDGMTDEAYHRDPVPGGSLSSTGARKLINECPAKFHHERLHGRPPKREFDFGHAAHQLVLGEGPELRMIPEELLATNGAISTKDAKEFVAQARTDGAVPLKPDDYHQVQAMATKLREHPVAGPLLRYGNGNAEQSAFWRDPITGIWRRARFDWLTEDRRGRLWIVDYKTTRSADTVAFGKAAMDLGYHQQDPWYRDAAIDLGLSDDPAFVFVLQEKAPPYVVTVTELNTTARRIGVYLNRQAIDLYAECTLTGHWPGYFDHDIAPTALPAWYERSFEEEIPL